MLPRVQSSLSTLPVSPSSFAPAPNSDSTASHYRRDISKSCFTVTRICLAVQVLTALCTVESFGIVTTTRRNQQSSLLGSVALNEDGSVSSNSNPWTKTTSRSAAGTTDDTLTLSSNGNTAAAASVETAIPFVVERVREQSTLKTYAEISSVCIEAFFNDSVETNTKQDESVERTSKNAETPFYKSWQLAYLRALQSADLERRRRRDAESNIMLVARQVVPATERSNYANQPLILDLRSVYNLPTTTTTETTDYVRGELLGFVEITQRFYGLGDDCEMKRPVLTNLAVRKDARRLGVGTALVDACERAVLSDWQGSNELILEVEDDNVRAQTFYERLGYQVVGSDPASRRYDTSGFWLQKVRCTRLIMRKPLNVNGAVSVAMSSVVEDTVNKGVQMLQRFRDNFKR